MDLSSSFSFPFFLFPFQFIYYPPPFSTQRSLIGADINLIDCIGTRLYIPYPLSIGSANSLVDPAGQPNEEKQNIYSLAQKK